MTNNKRVGIHAHPTTTNLKNNLLLLSHPAWIPADAGMPKEAATHKTSKPSARAWMPALRLGPADKAKK